MNKNKLNEQVKNYLNITTPVDFEFLIKEESKSHVVLISNDLAWEPTLGIASQVIKYFVIVLEGVKKGSSRIEFDVYAHYINKDDDTSRVNITEREKLIISV